MNGWEPRHSFRCGHRGKKDTYRLILKGSSFAQDPEHGEMGTESSGGYTITFDKNTFLSLGVDVYGKSENLNEEKKRKKRAEHGLFVRLFF